MILTRFAYLPDCTLGWLEHDGLRLATIERPWIPVPEHRGGKLRESCVPDGRYLLRHHQGPRFQDVWALINPALDVYDEPRDRGRSAILIHAGNTVGDVVGCIAVGLEHGELGHNTAVLFSQSALARLRTVLRDPLPSLEIRPTRGTVEIDYSQEAS